MASDVSVNQIDLMRAYCGHLRTFNGAVNSSILSFRHAAKQVEEELRGQLANVQYKVESKCEELDSTLNQLYRLKEIYTFGDVDLELIESAIGSIKGQIASIQGQFEAMKLRLQDIVGKVQQIDAKATMFSISNQQLLDGANNRLEHHLLALDQYTTLKK